MSSFRFSAYDLEGKLRKGSVDAASAEAAMKELTLRGLVPVDVKEESRKGGARRKKLSLQGHVLFCRSLSSYLKSSLPITEALELLKDQTPDKELGEAYTALLEDVRGGRRLAAAMKSQGTFRPGLVGMVESGESSGSLVDVLSRAAKVYRSEMVLRRKVQSALIYPVVMLVVGFGVITFLLAYVVPRLASLFEDMGQALPLPTRILLGISGFVQTFWLPLIAAACLLIWLGKRRNWGARMPFLRQTRENVTLSLVFSHLGTLVASGIPLTQALQMVAPMDPASERWREVAKSVKEGYRFAQSMDRQGSFPKDAIYLVRVGEMGSELEDALERVAETNWEIAESSMERLANLIEPIMILFLGGSVGFVVIAILLPIFDLSGLVK